MRAQLNNLYGEMGAPGGNLTSSLWIQFITILMNNEKRKRMRLLW